MLRQREKKVVELKKKLSKEIKKKTKNRFALKFHSKVMEILERYKQHKKPFVTKTNHYLSVVQLWLFNDDDEVKKKVELLHFSFRHLHFTSTFLKNKEMKIILFLLFTLLFFFITRHLCENIHGKSRELHETCCIFKNAHSS